MKELLVTIILIISFAIGNAQKIDSLSASTTDLKLFYNGNWYVGSEYWKKKTDPIKIDSFISWNYSVVSWNKDSIDVSVKMFADSTFEIEGDTMQAIKMLFTELQKYISVCNSAESVLNRINLDQLNKLIFKNEKQFTTAIKDYRNSKKKLEIIY